MIVFTNEPNPLSMAKIPARTELCRHSQDVTRVTGTIFAKGRSVGTNDE